jgi:hypothetical protein
VEIDIRPGRGVGLVAISCGSVELWRRPQAQFAQ